MAPTIPLDLSDQLFTTFGDLRVTRDRSLQIVRWFLATLGIDAATTPAGQVVTPTHHDSGVYLEGREPLWAETLEEVVDLVGGPVKLIGGHDGRPLYARVS